MYYQLQTCMVNYAADVLWGWMFEGDLDVAHREEATAALGPPAVQQQGAACWGSPEEAASPAGGSAEALPPRQAKGAASWWSDTAYCQPLTHRAHLEMIKRYEQEFETERKEAQYTKGWEIVLLYTGGQ